MEEIWKDYIYNYQISNLGNIRNKNTNRVLKQQINHNGYYYVCISLGSRNSKRAIRIHRAVAEIFLENNNNLSEVNHKDGNKSNNNVNNLEWCTSKYNSIHAFNNNLRYSKKGINHINSKLTKEDVLFIRNNYIPYNKEYGTRALSRKYNVDHMQIVNIVKNKTYVDVELM